MDSKIKIPLRIIRKNSSQLPISLIMKDIILTNFTLSKYGNYCILSSDYIDYNINIIKLLQLFDISDYIMREYSFVYIDPDEYIHFAKLEASKSDGEDLYISW